MNKYRITNMNRMKNKIIEAETMEDALEKYMTFLGKGLKVYKDVPAVSSNMIIEGADGTRYFQVYREL